MAEWLRDLTWNPIPSGSIGSNPVNWDYWWATAWKLYSSCKTIASVCCVSDFIWSFSVCVNNSYPILRRISCHGRNYSQPYFFKRNQSSDNRSHGLAPHFYWKNCLRVISAMRGNPPLSAVPFLEYSFRVSSCSKPCIISCSGSDRIRTHASEESGALKQRHRPFWHATSCEYMDNTQLK